MKGKIGFSRLLALVTYATVDQFIPILKNHLSSIRGYCYILHDEADQIPHFHILLRTFSPWKPEQVRRWFFGLQDQTGKEITTLCETIGDLDLMILYLTHSDPESIANGKFRYSDDDIFDYGFLKTVEKRDSKDSSFEIINSILSGMSFRNLVRLYGRDYVYHYKVYHELAQRIFQEDYKGRLKYPNYVPISPEQIDLIF